MRKTALIPTAVLAAGIVCASPAHAGRGDWTGKMALGNQANPNYTIPVEMHRIDDLHERMTAANGCVEEWGEAPGTVSNTQGNFMTGFVSIRVVSGEQFGCTSQPQVQIGITTNGTHRTETASSSDAAWLMYGDW
jgi:hypothetical protein